MNAEIDISKVELRTERLLIRPFRESDLFDFNAYAKVNGVGQMAGWKPHESIEESAGILKRFIEGKHEFALEYEGRVVGAVGVECYNEEQFPEFAKERAREIGFVLAKELWGQGLMPEAVRAVIRYLFEEVSLDRILCGHFPYNTRSARVQEKCGFRPYRTYFFHTSRGTVEECILSSLTKEEWEADQAPKEPIEVTVRPAEPADADAILAMLSQILELHAKLRPDLFRTGATKYSKEEILDIIGDPGRRSYVAADGNGVVLGYALCQLREQPGSRVALPYTSLYVDDLCVDETCRGRSVGRKLFEAAKAEAKALGCYELNLVVWEGNDRARAFYDKMGMKPKETMMELIL